jgi:hypothetical protein
MSYDTAAMMMWLEASWACRTSSSSGGGDGSSSSNAQQQQQPAPKAALQELWAGLIAELQQLLHSVESLQSTAEEVLRQQLPLASLQHDSSSSVTDTCSADYGSSGAGSGAGCDSSGADCGSSSADSGNRAAGGCAARLLAEHLKQDMYVVGHHLQKVLLPVVQGLARVLEGQVALFMPSFKDFGLGLLFVGSHLCPAGLPSNSCCSNAVCVNLGTASAMIGLVRGKTCVCGACVAASCSSAVDGGSNSSGSTGGNSSGSTAGGLPGRPTPRVLVPARCALLSVTPHSLAARL